MSAEERIREFAEVERKKLAEKVKDRMIEMETDSDDHYLMYAVLGVDHVEGKQIDLYQNKGRFLYKYAGAMAEKAAIICFEEKYGVENAYSKYVDNPVPNTSPKRFEIDCVVNEKYGYEIKWRDATTDGDHINKENRRLHAVKENGYIPVRLMFFPPMRTQAIRIQKRLKKSYEENGGIYYYGSEAWDHVLEETGIDLLSILQKIAAENTVEDDDD